MKREHWLSLRAGFTHAQAEEIWQLGIQDFLKKSFDYSKKVELPSYLTHAPATLTEFRGTKKQSEEKKKELQILERKRFFQMQHGWIQEIYTSPYPLREKMSLFWSNHFVTSHAKVKMTRLQWDLLEVFRKHAFGNIKTLTSEVLHHPAMLLYLDNHQNKRGALNENLSRELLELFTLGIGNYTENDIKEGAKALAGLTLAETGSQYVPRWEVDEPVSYLGQTGPWKAKDLVRIIFEHPKAPFRFAEKFLKWFVTDLPSEDMIDKFGNKLRILNYEVAPFLQYIFSELDPLKHEGTMIKNPLSFFLEVAHIYGLDRVPMISLPKFFKPQGMELLNPPNVKGWDGGRIWLDAQKLLQRHEIVHQISQGTIKNWNPKKEYEMEEPPVQRKGVMIKPSWSKVKEAILDMGSMWLIEKESDLTPILESVPYDLNPQLPESKDAIHRIVERICQMPEFQVY